MAKCSLCGNEYDKSFTVSIGDESRVFDSFECAIQAMAPSCSHCGCRIIGHGTEVDGKFYCCAHCAGAEGHVNLRDRADTAARRL